MRPVIHLETLTVPGYYVESSNTMDISNIQSIYINITLNEFESSGLIRVERIELILAETSGGENIESSKCK